MKNKLPEAAEAAGKAAKELGEALFAQDADDVKERIWKAIDGIQAAITALEGLPNEVSRINIRWLKGIEYDLKRQITEINEQ